MSKNFISLEQSHELFTKVGFYDIRTYAIHEIDYVEPSRLMTGLDTVFSFWQEGLPSNVVLDLKNELIIEMGKTSTDMRAREFMSPEFYKNCWDIIYNWEFRDVEEFREKYGSTDAVAQLNSVGTYFEGMGVMVNSKLLDVSLIDDLESGLLIRYWEKIKPVMISSRERFNYPQLAEWVEYLYNQIKPIAEAQHQESKT